MKNYYTKAALFITGIAILIIFGQSNTMASSEPNEPLALQKIMRDMGTAMQEITRGISREEWSKIKNNALAIAEHPAPPLSEKVRIMVFAGTDMVDFKRYDGKTHNAAKVLADLAAGGDGEKIIAGFADLQNSCLTCHKHFRKSFKNYFYGNL